MFVSLLTWGRILLYYLKLPRGRSSIVVRILVTKDYGCCTHELSMQLLLSIMAAGLTNCAINCW